MAYNKRIFYAYSLLISIIIASEGAVLEAYNINVVSFGAIPDGRRESTKAFVRAWSLACVSNRAATIYAPKGRFLLKPVVFSGPCRSIISFVIDGTLVAPTNYWSFGSSGYWILFKHVSRVSLFRGTLDARGSGFWACRKSGTRSCPPGARTISFLWSSNVEVRGLTSINSQIIHIAIGHSSNVMIRNVKIIAPNWSPNTDGIHVQFSSGVTISSSIIKTGDDCISIGPGSKNLWIDRIACGPGHGISIGSLGGYVIEEGVNNVTVTNTIFKGTQNGVRIKSWARPSNGYATNIMFRNIIMKHVYNPVIIDQKYCPDNAGCPRQNSGVKIRGITYKNIKGTSATKVAMNFICSSSNPCNGIRLQDIKLTYMNRPVAATATSLCINAHGTSKGVVVPRSCF